MKPSKPVVESLLDYALRIKGADRLHLKKLSAADAQAEVDAVLVASQWTIADRSELIWLGDLGDEAELPEWMSDS